jgi:hypothetical protein
MCRVEGIGIGAASAIVGTLAHAGILSRVVRGRTAFYRANRDCPVFSELHGLVIKTAGVADVLFNGLLALRNRIEVAFIYGSTARTRLRTTRPDLVGNRSSAR